MDEPAENPFTPIFGKIPAYMAGRTDLVDEMDFALKGAATIQLLSLFSWVLEAPARQRFSRSSQIWPKRTAGCPPG